MIIQVIELLQSQEWTGVSENVERAKGKHQYIFTFKQLGRYIKRQYRQWRSK